MRALLVDDEPVVRRSLGRLVGRLGFEVTFAAEGHAAIEACAATPPGGQPFDLMLLDVNMPGLSGWDVLAFIRRSQPALPVLMMTGELYDAGALDAHTGLLVKPFDKERLRTTLARWFPL